MRTIIYCSILLIVFSTCSKKLGNKDISFNSQILPIFVTNCSVEGCHNSKTKHIEYDLSNYNGIMQGVVPKYPLLSPVYTSIKGNNPSMPQSPYSKLTSKEVELIKLWINMGATNTDIVLPCDTSSATFSKTVQPIFTSWCIGCHKPSNLGAGIDLTTYAGIVASQNNNSLLGSIEHMSGFSQMPKNTNKLSDCDIAIIKKWLREGAINN